MGPTLFFTVVVLAVCLCIEEKKFNSVKPDEHGGDHPGTHCEVSSSFIILWWRPLRLCLLYLSCQRYQLFKTRVAESQLWCSHKQGVGLRGDVGLNSILTVCCSHCHCSRQSVMAIGQSWLADDDGYDSSTPYYHSSVYGWYNGFVWWVRFLSTLHLLHREEELRSMGKATFVLLSVQTATTRIF